MLKLLIFAAFVVSAFTKCTGVQRLGGPVGRNSRPFGLRRSNQIDYI
jgi:hypothetical protein